MPQDNKPLEERIDKLTEAVSVLGDKITAMEKRQSRIERLVLPIGFTPLPADAPPKPPPNYGKEGSMRSAEMEKNDQGAGAGDIVPKPPQGSDEEESFESEIGTKWLGRIGIFALVLGVSFFLKYAFDNDWIGETGRVVMGIIAGLSLVVLGEYFRQKYLNYAQILTGGGIAILYLSIYAAFGYYSLIDQLTAFAAMSVITFAAGFLAVHYERMNLAALAILGGFLTPILLSNGTNNQIGLFTYITLLNLGVLGISFFRNWRKLNLLGFFGSMFLFSGWSVAYYSSDQLFLTELFLTTVFMIYSVATVSHNIIEKNVTEGLDAALITLNALAYFALSYSYLNPYYSDFMGFFAVLMALVYLVFAVISFRLNPEDKYLALFMPGLSILFLTLAIPIQFDGNWVTIGWLIEAAILVKAGFSLANREMRTCAWVIFTLALIKLTFMDSVVMNLNDYLIIFNKRFLTFAIGIIVTAAIYYLYSQHEKLADSDESGARKVTLFLANFLLLLILSAEVITYFDQKVNLLDKPVYPSCQMYDNTRGGQWNKNYICNDKYNDYMRATKERIEQVTGIKNTQNVILSVLWLVYAIVILAFGFLNKKRSLRMMGMGLFGITIFKIFFFDLWYLGSLYRIISSVSLGAVLLVASFAYTKYKDKIREII